MPLRLMSNRLSFINTLRGLGLWKNSAHCYNLPEPAETVLKVDAIHLFTHGVGVLESIKLWMSSASLVRASRMLVAEDGHGWSKTG
jgi:hypothetical protein